MTPSSAAGKRIGLVASTSSDPFAKAVTGSIVDQVDAAGATLTRCDPGGDGSLLLDCSRRMIAERVDGWIAVQPGKLGEALCAAGLGGVPLIAITSVPLTCQTAGVGADDQQAGVLAGQELGRIVVNGPGCADIVFVIVTDSADPTVSEPRIAGIRAGFQSRCPGPRPDERVLDAGTQDRAYDAFRSALAAMPEDRNIVVAAVNDGAALGVVAAIPDSRAEKIRVASIGADQRAHCEISANSRWLGDAALFPERYGEVAVPALLDVLEGRPVPVQLTVQALFLTASTVGGFYDLDDCPTG